MSEEGYTPEVLAVVCPQCSAAKTGRCLYRRPSGGSAYLTEPHAIRVLHAELVSRARRAANEPIPPEAEFVSRMTKTKPQDCPKCGARVDAVTAISGKDEPEPERCVAVCFHCGVPLTFDDEWNLHPADMAIFPMAIKKEIARIQAAILMARMMRN